jgi:NADH:ubiquinone oxidoreductase subunit F (NADH-binding)/NADH:ubiquinone oxidoreductase subunit E/NAD-dependent dihydropyrimidine dehydrogenase PreA subunit
MQPIDVTVIDAILSRTGTGPEKALVILQAIERHYAYLPKEALERVCEKTQIRPADLWGVATFYDQFRLEPAGKYRVRVCVGTACHVKGSERVYDAFRRALEIEPGKDTDNQNLFTVEKIACLGCCTLAPVVQINQKVYGPVQPEMVADILDAAQRQSDGDFIASKTGLLSQDVTAELRVGIGSCCVAGGSMDVRRELDRTLAGLGLEDKVAVKPVGCVGMCHQTPLVEVLIRTPNVQTAENGENGILYTKVTANEAGKIVRRHFRPRGLLRRIKSAVDEAVEGFVGPSDSVPVPRAVRDGEICAFLGGQKRIATEYCGHLDPLDVDEYSRNGGFEALRHIETMTPQDIIEQMKQSGLRGRGGAGFATGRKWQIANQAQDSVKYIICNGDEGDPGAFMDRMILESYPYRVLEGMAIAAKAVGAKEGYLYIRAEYPLAVQRIRAAIQICQERKLLDGLKLSIAEGAGAFVCGEETALIASIEGRRGMPSIRPPFPAQNGLWGKPTLINNVETYATVPWIFRNGSQVFASIGTEKSKGTKVFALAGKVKRGGLIEVPMGMTIRQIVENIGGGVAGDSTFKAVQVGGPSGGCVPAQLADTPIDFESLAEVGSMMGSGGLVVMDENDCMVDIARYFLEFTQAQSCGKCTFCRVGTKRMLEMLSNLCRGKDCDLDELEALARQVKAGSLCGLGKTAPNPILSTLKYFRQEYEAHRQGHCPAGKCRDLIRFVIGDKCNGCTICAQNCPVSAITPKPYQKHEIQQSACVRCGTCKNICPEKAIDVES